MRPALLRAGVLGLSLMVSACVHLEEPDAADLTVEVPAGWTAVEASDPLVGGWLMDFEDLRLPELMEEALASNLNLQVAAARMEQAVQLARIEGADRWPDLALAGSARRQMSNNLSEPVFRTRFDRFDLGFQASWELDIWGKVRARGLAANADAAAAMRDLEAVRLSLAGQVAGAWFSALAAGQQRHLAEETLASFQSNMTSVEERFQRGLIPALDLRLSRANVANAEATLRQREREADLAVRQLEVLLGRYPAARLELEPELPALPTQVPAGMPSTLLERRPDIQAASQRLQGADARLFESRRALLPSINLTGSYGSASDDLSNLLEDGFDVWSLVGGLTAPLFQGGRLRANVARSEAALAEALATYQQTVLTAFREVEAALAGEAFLREQLSALEEAAAQSTGAQELAEERYERGLVDIITVLESQRRAFTSRSAVLSAQNALLQNRLALYLALGGDLR